MTGHFHHVFKTVTSDNGTEFSDLTMCLKDTTDVCFTHPYSSWERVTNENHNGIIRCFVPKGTNITNLSERTSKATEDWMNRYPRKVLKGATPLEAFLKKSG